MTTQAKLSTRWRTAGGNFSERQREVDSYMRSLSGRASIRRLELLATVFDDVDGWRESAWVAKAAT